MCVRVKVAVCVCSCKYRHVCVRVKVPMEGEEKHKSIPVSRPESHRTLWITHFSINEHNSRQVSLIDEF